MLRIKELLFTALVAGCVGCAPATAPTPVPAPDTKAQDMADIKALEDRFTAAFKAKDIGAIMACYTPDEAMVVFDVPPPLQYTGATAYRKDWTDFFAGSVGPVEFSLTDLDVTVGGDVAYGHSIQRVAMTDKKGKKGTMTVRVTDGYKKVNGQWLISHEHVSVPVDLATLKAVANAK